MFVEAHLLFSKIQRLPVPTAKWVESVFMPLLSVCVSCICLFF